MFNGKTHYKWPCSIAMLVYQRVHSKEEREETSHYKWVVSAGTGRSSASALSDDSTGICEAGSLTLRDSDGAASGEASIPHKRPWLRWAEPVCIISGRDDNTTGAFNDDAPSKNILRADSDDSDLAVAELAARADSELEEVAELHVADVCFRLGHDQPCQGTPLVVWKKWYQLTDHCHQLNGIASFLVSSDYAFCPLEELRICRRGGLVTLQKAQQTSNRLQPCHICQVLIVGLGSSSMLSSPKPRLSSYQMLQVCHNESHIIPLSIQATCELSASIKPGDTWYKASLAHRGTLVDPESCSATNSQTRKTMENRSMAHVCIMFVYHTPGPGVMSDPC